MAGLISSNVKEKGNLPKAGALHYLSTNTASFLRNHSQWAYEQLNASLTGKDEETKPKQVTTISDVQGDIETTREEVAQGNLLAWHIFYTDNKSLDDKHLVEIGGSTLKEREETLEALRIKEQIPLSIKPGSVIRALDWLVTVPQDVEQVRIRKDIGGEEFKKLKRGDLRILYQMRPPEKAIIFFLHQKQAWTYGF